MQLRTFLARDMKEALASVRADMGPNAVIIATEKAKSGGVMVRAALDSIDEDEAVAAATPPNTPATAADVDALFRNGLLYRLRQPGDRAKRASFDRAELLAALRRHRLPDGLAHALAERAAKAELSDMTLALAAALDASLKPDPLDLATAGAFLLVGPNGAGKTAVAAKIAAHARLAGRRTTLIAADTAGAGAVARLETFAKHLDSAIATADTAPRLNTLVSECLSKKTFVVVDTAGFDPREPKARTAFAGLAQIPKLEAIGVVSALSDAEEMSEIAEALAGLGARRLVVTGCDLARRAGALITAATAAIPLAHLTRSPFVAGGLEQPTSLTLARLLLDEQRSPQ
jgi:flagellar biosynthesis protein FlhF